MGYPLSFSLRYLISKKSSFISVSTLFAILGVTLGVAALFIVMSVTAGFQEQFREKVLGVNAHVLVLKHSADFREYREVIKKIEHVKGVIGIAPFVINPMMITHRDRVATGVLLKGVDPETMPNVLDLPRHIVEGTLSGLRRPDAKPPAHEPSPFSFKPSERTTQAAPQNEHDAGALPFLETLRKQLNQASQDSEEKQAPTIHGAPVANFLHPASSAASEPTRKAKGTIPPNALAGSILPEGGFASNLPEEDLLPETLDLDPCQNSSSATSLPGVIVGRTLASQLNLRLGDCIQITSPSIGLSYGLSSRPPLAKPFRVIALFEAGFDQYDSKLVYIDLYEAQAFYEQGDSVTGIEMKLADLRKSGETAHEIEKILENSIYHTMDWKELNRGLFTALFIQEIGMSVVLTLILVVATFTVIATLIMRVLDKRKEIALLKALGAQNNAILRIFLYQGSILGLVGTLCGLLLGYMGCKVLSVYYFPLDPKVYFLSKLPVVVRSTELLVTSVLAILICLTATFFPALHAARLSPSDGLRSE